jgi:hypothetical protein
MRQSSEGRGGDAYRRRLLRASGTLAIGVLGCACWAVDAQQPVAMTTPPADPAIAAAIAKISPARIHDDIAKMVSFHNRSTLSSNDKDLPAGQGYLAAADWVESQFKSYSAACGGCLEVKRDDFVEPGKPRTRIAEDTRLVNVYAVLRGTDPAQAPRMVLVTGHLDSRGTSNEDTHGGAPGANDDASGVSVSLECARVLSTMKFPATIVFVAVDGEEQGLNGSAHLAKLAKEQGWKLEAVLNNDIVGGDTTPGETMQRKDAVRVFSEGVPAHDTIEEVHRIEQVGGESDSTSRELARAISQIAATYMKPMQFRAPSVPGRPHSMLIRVEPPFHPVMIFRTDRFLRGGDHTSFNAEGFAAVRFTEWRENFDHQHQTPRVEDGVIKEDRLEFVDPSYVAHVAEINAATLATLAAAPGEPQQVQVLTQKLDNNTELTWQAPDGAPDGTQYQVLWRDTSAPNWEEMQAVGSATHVTIPVSKDNVIFGVRSIDAAGHASPAVMPLPLRGGGSRPTRPVPPASPTPRSAS